MQKERIGCYLSDIDRHQDFMVFVCCVEDGVSEDIFAYSILSHDEHGLIGKSERPETCLKIVMKAGMGRVETDSRTPALLQFRRRTEFSRDRPEQSFCPMI